MVKEMQIRRCTGRNTKAITFLVFLKLKMTGMLGNTMFKHTNFLVIFYYFYLLSLSNGKAIFQ